MLDSPLILFPSLARATRLLEAVESQSIDSASTVDNHSRSTIRTKLWLGCGWFVSSACTDSTLFLMQVPLALRVVCSGLLERRLMMRFCLSSQGWKAKVHMVLRLLGTACQTDLYDCRCTMETILRTMMLSTASSPRRWHSEDR